MLLIDFMNAFNLVDRSTLIKEERTHCPCISRWIEFCYSKPMRLYYNESILLSTQGVQQGDPLGPLLFALALHPIALKIAAECTLDLHAWYLDDGTIAGDTLEVAEALRIIQDDGPIRGLHLNIAKTELFWPSFDPRRDVAGTFPAAISQPVVGVKILGGPVSSNVQFCMDTI